MLKQLPKLLLLVALLSALVVSSAPTFGRGKGCVCVLNGGTSGKPGGCNFKNGQCINTGCTNGWCAFNI